MQYILIVALGGALGAVSRYGVSHLVASQLSSYLIGTYIVNVSGSFLVGLLEGLASKYPVFPTEIRLFLTVGFLGSYTTFSAFSLATVQLFQKGEVQIAALNIFASIVVGVLVAVIGMIIGRAI
tara:strand:- start:626 stop:997 length:372 start_codon:yes stop_codon:yes gene_type:complete